MSQEFLLNTPATPVAAKLDNAKANHQPAKPENEGKQSFSSALDKQVERRDIDNERQLEKTKPAEEQPENKLQEDVDEQESGKILPEEETKTVTSTDKEAEITEETAEKLLDVSIITELKSETAKPLTTKLASPEQLAAASVAITENSQSKVKNQLQSEVKTNPILVATVSSKNENSDVDGLELAKKSTTTNLRSDIFHALSKNKASESALLDNAVSKDHKTVLNQLSDRAERSDRSAATFSSALSATPSLNSTAVPNSSAIQTALAIQPAIHSEAWNRVLSSRVVWMVREGIQEASLKLNPATLGAVDVKLNMHSDQANVLFIAQSAATRDALEQALPKLRESFAENGMQLADAEVADQEFEQSENEQSAQNGTALAAQAESENEQPAMNAEQDVEMGLSIYA